MDGAGGDGEGRVDGKPVELEAGGGELSPLHHRNHQFFRQIRRPGVVFGVVVVTCLILYHSAYPFQFSPQFSLVNDYSIPDFNSSSFNLDKKVGSNLKKVLEKASTDDKTVILTTLNAAWATPNSIFDVFLESFRIGNETEKLLRHLVIVTVDEKAYNRCLAIHPHCFVLRPKNGKDFSKEAYFMAPDYFEMMWSRLSFLHFVLKLGYNFIFTDTDIMWFRNPFPRFHLGADFQIASDYYQGNPSNLKNMPNGGFQYVKSNNRSIEFFKFWTASRNTYPGLNEQDVLNRIKFDPLIKKIGLKIRFLDTRYFGGFCQASRNLNEVCTMHANCCYGLDNKIYDLKILLQDWRKYLLRKANGSTSSHPTSWTAPQKCLHSHRRKTPPRRNK